MGRQRKNALRQQGNGLSPGAGDNGHAPRSEAAHRAFESYLIRLGLRQTRQRRIVLDALLCLGSHVAAETVAAEARRRDASIGLATVYRSLQLLVGAGLVAERTFDKERAHFELIDPDRTHHDHLICTQCGKIIEFFDEDLEALQERIAQRLGFRLTDHRMELYGDCEGRCGHRTALGPRR